MLDQTCIAVVVPCYPAGPHIAEVVRSLPGFVDDIVVVDDGSSPPAAAAVDAASDPSAGSACVTFCGTSRRSVPASSPASRCSRSGSSSVSGTG